MNPGSIVLLYLTDPADKYWGVVETLHAAGVTIRGINLSSFEDWMGELIEEGEPSLSPATVFFPLHRITRMALDEPMGQAESLEQSFERRVGSSISAYLGMEDLASE
jgi:hypothetical protein